MNQRQAVHFANKVFEAVADESMSYTEAESVINSLQTFMDDSQATSVKEFFNRLPRMMANA